MSASTDEARIESMPELAEQAQFYDRRWRGRPCRYLDGIRLRRAVSILCEISELGLENPRILDLGCGAGVFSGMLSSVGEVTGVDLSSVDLSEAYFDLIVLQEVIEHVEDQAGLIDRCRQLLKPGGYIVVTTPNSRIAHLSGKISTAEQKGNLQPIEKLLTVQGLRRLMATQFVVRRCFTIIPAGYRGWLRLVNSPRLTKFRAWRAIQDALPVGLHTVVVAQRSLSHELDE